MDQWTNYLDTLLAEIQVLERMPSGFADLIRSANDIHVTLIEHGRQTIMTREVVREYLGQIVTATRNIDALAIKLGLEPEVSQHTATLRSATAAIDGAIGTGRLSEWFSE